jgi:hypothetical protein
MTSPGQRVWKILQAVVLATIFLPVAAFVLIVICGGD